MEHGPTEQKINCTIILIAYCCINLLSQVHVHEHVQCSCTSNVTLVLFPDLVSTCGLNFLLVLILVSRVFFQVLGSTASSIHKNQHFQISIGSGIHGPISFCL